jgi:hypothetical protein
MDKLREINLELRKYVQLSNQVEEKKSELENVKAELQYYQTQATSLKRRRRSRSPFSPKGILEISSDFNSDNDIAGSEFEIFADESQADLSGISELEGTRQSFSGAQSPTNARKVFYSTCLGVKMRLPSSSPA